MKDRELIDGAKAIARDLKLPNGGRLKLAKVIDRHLSWFEAARLRGLEWEDIIRLLSAEGVTRPDGRALSRGHLSSLVWRKSQVGGAQRATAAGKHSAASPPRPRQVIDIAGRKPAGGGDDARTPSKAAAKQPRVKRGAASRRRSGTIAGTSAERMRPTEGGGRGAPPALPSEKREILASIQRAARLRGGSDDVEP